MNKKKRPITKHNRRNVSLNGGKTYDAKLLKWTCMNNKKTNNETQQSKSEEEEEEEEEETSAPLSFVGCT